MATGPGRYSEVKGDNVLELPLERLLIDERMPAGASGAAATAARYGLNPGPDFRDSRRRPGGHHRVQGRRGRGTARDKASRIKNLAEAGPWAGLVVCALIDGKGWTERPTALVDVVVATDGRTHSLATLTQILSVPEVAGLRGARSTRRAGGPARGLTRDPAPHHGASPCLSVRRGTL